MPKVDEVFFRSPSRKLGINDEEIKRKTLRDRRAKKEAAKVASEKLSKVRSQQGSLRQEGIVKQGSIGPQIDIGQVASNVPTTPEQDTASGVFKGEGGLVIEKPSFLPDLFPSVRNKHSFSPRTQTRDISGPLNEQIQSNLIKQGQLPTQTGDISGPLGEQIQDNIKAQLTPEADISGPLSEQIKSNLALQSQQQTRDLEAQRQTVEAQAKQAVESGVKGLPQQVNKATAQLATQEGASNAEATAAGNKAEKDFKVLGVDGKSALLAAVGIGLIGVGASQDARGTIRGVAGSINQQLRDRSAANLAAQEQANEERKLGQVDRSLGIKEKLGLAGLEAQKAKLASGPSAKDRPTISETAAASTVDSFVEENLSELDLTDENKADLALQLRERQKLTGGSPVENLQKIILEQFTTQTDPGIFFDDNKLIRK